MLSNENENEIYISMTQLWKKTMWKEGKKIVQICKHKIIKLKKKRKCKLISKNYMLKGKYEIDII
jgi:hypothetical protein